MKQFDRYKSRLYTVIFVLLLSWYPVIAQKYIAIERITGVSKTEKGLLLTTGTGAQLLITMVRDDILRIQVAPDGKFEPSLMIEHGFVKDDFPAISFIFSEDQNSVTLSSKKLIAEIKKYPFSIRFLDSEKKLLTRLSPSEGISVSSGGNLLTFDMPADEHFYGFGFMRSTFDARGKKLVWKRGYRWNEATVPFFMSTRNYGFYSNNTWDHEFDFKPESSSENMTGTEQYRVSNAGGQLDFYLFAGNDFKEILNTYTDLTGKSWLVPKASMGVMYRCRTPENQAGVLRIAGKFRDLDIPVDIMALEPGWEAVNYGDTWKWSPERFPDPKGMIATLKKMGFRFDLWESGMAPSGNILEDTVRKEWYRRRFPVLDDGVRSFKQDDPYPRGIQSQGYDPAVINVNKIKSGKYSHQELVNIANSLFTETAFKEFRNHTGERAVIQFHAYNASVASHRWPYQWGGDFSAGNGMLNAGLSGHALTSEDMRDYSPKGLHHDYLTPVPVLDSWAYYKEPWLYSNQVESGHRFYARFRQKLVPYLYTSLWQSHTKALPVMRPMILEYQKDVNTYNMKGEYMLGDWLLVVAEPSKAEEFTGVDFTKREGKGTAYLPAGEWINYWTGEVYRLNEGQNVSINWPDYAGGGLFVKAGAIIPVGRANRFTGENPDEVIDLEVYPSGKSSYTLYEDDGISYDYEKGGFATSTFTCSHQSGIISLKAGVTEGTYKTMPSNRVYLLKIFSELPPAEVINRGTRLNEFKDRDALLYAGQAGWYYDVPNKKIILKTDKRWKLVKNENRIERNNSLDMELDDIVFESSGGIRENPVDITIKTDSRPVLVCDFENSHLPADGFSKTGLRVRGKEINGARTMTDNQDFILTLEGPATFENGKKSISLKYRKMEQVIPVYVSAQTGAIKLKGPETIRLIQNELTASGVPASIRLTPLFNEVVADSVSMMRFKTELLDEKGNLSVPTLRRVLVRVSGEGKVAKGQDTVLVSGGTGYFDVVSTPTPGIISAQVSAGNILSNTCKITSEKGKLQVVTNPPEEFVFPHNGSYATWVKTAADVMVRFTANGKTIRSVTPRTVTLKVFDKERRLLKELTTNSVNGEAIFPGVDYYSRPGKCYFTLSSKGYDDVELKIFENTWDKQ